MDLCRRMNKKKGGERSDSPNDRYMGHPSFVRYAFTTDHSGKGPVISGGETWTGMLARDAQETSTLLDCFACALTSLLPFPLPPHTDTDAYTHAYNTLHHTHTHSLSLARARTHGVHADARRKFPLLAGYARLTAAWRGGGEGNGRVRTYEKPGEKWGKRKAM